MSMAGDSAGFESYLRGSWWDVQVKEVRSSMFLVSYNADKDEDMAWVPLTELRLSSRRGDGWDCSILKKGMDVSVLYKHPHSNSLNLQKEGLYDAKITSVARSIHAPGECSCKFSLIFFGIKMKTYTDGSLVDRKPLANEPETQVSIFEVRILQKPSKKISFQDVVDAHLARKWIPFGRGCKNAYFLTETDLSNERPRGACAHEVDHTGPAPSPAPAPAPVRSDEVLSMSAARVSMKTVDEGSNCNSPVDSPDIEIIDPGTPEDEFRIPRSLSGARRNEKQQHSEGDAEGTSPQSMSIKHKSVPAQGHEDDDQLWHDRPEPWVPKKRGRPRRNMPDKTGTRVDCNGDQSNGILDEGAPRKSAHHPRKDMPEKISKRVTIMPRTGVRITEEKKVYNNPDVTSTPGFNKVIGKKFKGYTHAEEKVFNDPDVASTPALNKVLGKRYTRGDHNQNVNLCRGAVEDRPQPEWTETINVSSDDDEPSEYQPEPSEVNKVRKTSRMSYEIRTRDKINLRKPKTEVEEQPNSGKDTGPSLRSSLYANRYSYSKYSQKHQGKRDYRVSNSRTSACGVPFFESDLSL